MPVVKNYLPHVPSPYVHPGLPREERRQITINRKTKLDEVITYLATLQLPKERLERRSSCRPLGSNSLCNLVTYLVTRPLQIFKSAFCCCFKSCNTSVKYVPIPREASEILEKTKEQFERNTCGVCCIAPTVIAASPFIPGSATIATLLNILSGLVITTTAGTNTYLFSGNMGVVSDGHGDLIVQGGISVDATIIMKNAFLQLSEHLHEKWRDAAQENKPVIYQECLQITKKWDFLYQTIADSGVTKTTVEDILAPFSKAITQVLDQGEDLLNARAEAESFPTLNPKAHFVVVDVGSETKNL